MMKRLFAVLLALAMLLSGFRNVNGYALPKNVPGLKTAEIC